MKAMIASYPYEIAAIFLCGIGLLTLMLHQNLIRKCLGANLFSSSVFLFFGARGYLSGGSAPIVNAETLLPPEIMVNPIPSSLLLTGIVVSVSITACFLALSLRIYEQYGSLNLDEITRPMASHKEPPHPQNKED